MFASAASVEQKVDVLARLVSEAQSDVKAELLSLVQTVDAKLIAHKAEVDKALGELQEQLRTESEDLRLQRQDLAAREADLTEREHPAEAGSSDVEARQDCPPPTWLEKAEGTVNVAVVGSPGAGKSLLVNRLRGMRRRAQGWAEVGVRETTKQAAMYALPSDGHARLWDLPGAGAEGFPEEKYSQVMGLRHFDSVLIVTAGRFTSVELQLQAEMRECSVPTLMVRTKVDVDVENNKQDNGASQGTTLRQIREELRLRNGLADLYLVSSRDPELYDMHKLRREAFPGAKSSSDGEPPPPSPREQPDGWPGARAAALRAAPSELLARIQGQWTDRQDRTHYVVDGSQTYVTLKDGRTAVVELTEHNNRVWWCKHWCIGGDSVAKARRYGELRWTPVDLGLQPLVWRWMC